MTMYSGDEYYGDEITSGFDLPFDHLVQSNVLLNNIDYLQDEIDGIELDVHDEELTDPEVLTSYREAFWDMYEREL